MERQAKMTSEVPGLDVWECGTGFSILDTDQELVDNQGDKELLLLLLLMLITSFD